eukprot:1584470-Heterocapsa_arctica.AAC.1
MGVASHWRIWKSVPPALKIHGTTRSLKNFELTVEDDLFTGAAQGTMNFVISQITTQSVSAGIDPLNQRSMRTDTAWKSVTRYLLLMLGLAKSHISPSKWSTAS